MSETGYGLVIGDKNYSSWSLRPWLAMRRFSIPFEEINITLYEQESRIRILKHSPSALVPALIVGDRTIWDTLAILETLAEWHDALPLWPKDRYARALARSICAEMHSGFVGLRDEMPMNITGITPAKEISEAVQQNIRRIIAIWKQARDCDGQNGPFLFGDFSIADAMYAPVATRLRTFAVDLAAYDDDGTASAYIDTLFAMPEMSEWVEGAREELARRGSA